MFGVPLWAIVAAVALLALALLVFGACVLAGQKPHARPPRHQRPRDSHPRVTREDWLNGTGSFSLDDERALHGPAGVPQRTLRPFPGDEGATVIEGPWAGPEPETQPCCGQALAYCYCADRAGSWPARAEYLPAPELLDDLDGAGDNLAAARAELATARGKLAQAHDLLDRIDGDLDEAADPLPPSHEQRPSESDGATYCLACEERCTPAQPCTCCWLGDLSEDAAEELDDHATARGPGLDDQAAELDDCAGATACYHGADECPDKCMCPCDPCYRVRTDAYTGDAEDQAAELDEWQAGWEADDLPPDPGRYSRHAELSGAYEEAPELVLAEEAHAAQLRAQDADARAFMEGKAAELAEFRRSLGPAR